MLGLHGGCLPLSLQVHSTVLYTTLSYSILLFSTLLYSTLLYSTLLYYTILYSTIFYSTLFYSTSILLYSSLLYPTLLHSPCNEVFYTMGNQPLYGTLINTKTFKFFLFVISFSLQLNNFVYFFLCIQLLLSQTNLVSPALSGSDLA